MGDPIVPASVARSISDSFAHVRVFRSVSPSSGPRLTQTQGLLFLASDSSIATRSPATLVERIPSTALQDLVEWGPETNPENQISDILANEVPIDTITASVPHAIALDDDHPVNEYYILRHLHVADGQSREAAIGMAASTALRP